MIRAGFRHVAPVMAASASRSEISFQPSANTSIFTLALTRTTSFSTVASFSDLGDQSTDRRLLGSAAGRVFPAAACQIPETSRTARTPRGPASRKPAAASRKGYRCPVRGSRSAFFSSFARSWAATPLGLNNAANPHRAAAVRRKRSVIPGPCGAAVPAALAGETPAPQVVPGQLLRRRWVREDIWHPHGR